MKKMVNCIWQLIIKLSMHTLCLTGILFCTLIICWIPFMYAPILLRLIYSPGIIGFWWPRRCKVITLNFTIELTKPKMLFYTKVIQKISVQSCPPSAANTMLGICYTCEALCCSAHGCCAVECGVAYCAAQHTAIATLTLPHTRLVAHQPTEQL